MACRGVWTGTSPEAIPEANQEATVARPLAAAKGPVATTAVALGVAVAVVEEFSAPAQSHPHLQQIRSFDCRETDS